MLPGYMLRLVVGCLIYTTLFLLAIHCGVLCAWYSVTGYVRAVLLTVILQVIIISAQDLRPANFVLLSSCRFVMTISIVSTQEAGHRMFGRDAKWQIKLR